MSGNKTQAGRNALGIRYFTKGPAPLINRLNEILRGMDALYLRNSGDILGSVTPDGTFARLRDPNGDVARGTALLPFAIYNASEPGSLRVGIHPGVVNGLPPNVDGISILDEPPPYLAIDATSRIVLEATIDASDEITALDIVAVAGTAAPASDYVAGVGGTARISLGIVTVSGTLGTLSIPTQDVHANLSLGVGGGYFWASV